MMNPNCNLSANPCKIKRRGIFILSFAWSVLENSTISRQVDSTYGTVAASINVLSVCNESLNFSLENSESLLEFPTISR